MFSFRENLTFTERRRGGGREERRVGVREGKKEREKKSGRVEDRKNSILQAHYEDKYTERNFYSSPPRSDVVPL